MSETNRILWVAQNGPPLIASGVCLFFLQFRIFMLKVGIWGHSTDSSACIRFDVKENHRLGTDISPFDNKKLYHNFSRDFNLTALKATDEPTWFFTQ
jgi:hypothetical protein